MDLDPPTLGFPGERPVIERKQSFFDGFSAFLGSDIIPEAPPVTSVLIKTTRPGKYKLDLSRFTD